MRCETSTLAYNKLRTSGRLSKRRWQCYDCLYRHGPLTGQEVSKITGIPGMWKRCSELEAIGVVKAVGEKICSETRQTSTAWDVTDYIPCSEDYAKLRTSRATFWIVFSEKSGRMGCASPDKQDVAKVHEAWLKKPGYQDAKIFKAQVVKPE